MHNITNPPTTWRFTDVFLYKIFSSSYHALILPLWDTLFDALLYWEPKWLKNIGFHRIISYVFDLYTDSALTCRYLKVKSTLPDKIIKKV
jgi:hypothetical protein